MSDEPETPPTWRGAQHAPVIYFDEVPANAGFNGIVAVSLGSYLHQVKDGELLVECAMVGYLRCNVQGATALRDALDRAIQRATNAA